MGEQRVGREMLSKEFKNHDWLLEREQVARRQLHLLLLLRAIREADGRAIARRKSRMPSV